MSVRFAPDRPYLMQNKILILALRTIALSAYADRSEVIDDLIDQEGPVMALLVIDHISQSQGGPPVDDETMGKAVMIEVMKGILSTRPPVEETELDGSLN